MSNNASYDRALLDDAPEVTPQQRQRFYDADLLYDDANRERQRTTSDAAPLPAGAAPAVVRSNTDLEAAPIHSKEYTPLPPPSTRKAPWYKTRKGIIAIVIIAIVVIGAVVGGAVGGTQGNKNSSKSSDQTSSASLLSPTIAPLGSSTAAQSQGVGQGGASSSTAHQSQGSGQGTAGLASASPTQSLAGQQGAATAIAVASNPLETGVEP